MKQANGIARSMITKYGMSETLGNLVFGNENDEVFIGRDLAQTRNYSEEVAAQIDREVKKIIDSCYEKITNILKENINKLQCHSKCSYRKRKA
ncbi:cell division protein FtsH [Acetivibrio straminisolvens JCM 21531]|uniref:Cell division protein FtsH n=1 Tax=Acetivibrio straminisolvens JCM 21531 TaxID=1294263 RepID=W4V4S0_9FIRM|nr:cell division protein FtsH [Acetivibrio straminisolvens JCM 21531]